jgi:hypothetical protein
VGHEPTFRGYFCDKFEIIDENTLEFSYEAKNGLCTKRTKINNDENIFSVNKFNLFLPHLPISKLPILSNDSKKLLCDILNPIIN